MGTANLQSRLDTISDVLSASCASLLTGHVSGVTGLSVEIAGLSACIAIGDRLKLHGRDTIGAEVTGFKGQTARAMPLGSTAGVGPGSVATVAMGARAPGLAVSDAWLGRIIDPLGNPLDGKGSLPPGPIHKPVRAAPPPAATRARLGERIPLGVRVLDLFTTCRSGQRLGLFAGSGVGKSTLLSMMAQDAQCDVVVLALVGERGREVREFIEDDLGPAMDRSVVIVATSDQPPLLRREAAYAAMTVAEHFRDAGRSVLLMMDSVTRFCLALREIGLANGEPPATRGYPPSVFAELPCLLERAGPAAMDAGGGSITGLFTVLVEGDDHNEPIADAVRGILDGHVVLDRTIAEAGQFPAVNVLRSLSRTVPGCLLPAERRLAVEARAILSRQAELAELVRLGLYKAGTDPESDRAIHLAPAITALLKQDRGSGPGAPQTFADLFEHLGSIMETAHAA